ncbi:hypothetical protein SH661x_000122 [Planctomicrobium sp. SH661]|uniref:hypothetical protein n=1 Tax=Planctomicrobium sp. SH661 TaxID=3448124 RepID=UPI003F5C85CD
MIRFSLLALIVLTTFTGCKSSSKYAPWTYWRPNTAAAAQATSEELNYSYADGMQETSNPAYVQAPQPLPRIETYPPAPSFQEPLPTPAPPTLFPME